MAVYVQITCLFNVKIMPTLQRHYFSSHYRKKGVKNEGICTAIVKTLWALDYKLLFFTVSRYHSTAARTAV